MALDNRPDTYGRVRWVAAVIAALGDDATGANVQFAAGLTRREWCNDKRLAVAYGAIVFDPDDGVWVSLEPAEALTQEAARVPLYFKTTARCPTCFTDANDLASVDRLFGFRPVGRKLYPRQRCKACVATPPAPPAPQPTESP